MAHRRLLRERHPAHAVPTALRQPAFRFRHHRARSAVLPQQGVQVYRHPQLRHTTVQRCSSRDRSPLRGGTICTDYQPDTFQRPDIRHLLPTLSAAVALHVGTDAATEDFLLLRLPVPVQRHQLFQPQSGQTADW